jgi:hypothetical protein
VTGKNLFSPASLDAIVRETLPADAKPGEKVVIATVDDAGLKVVASFKLKDKWELQAAAHHPWNGDARVGARVLLRW